MIKKYKKKVENIYNIPLNKTDEIIRIIKIKKIIDIENDLNEMDNFSKYDITEGENSLYEYEYLPEKNLYINKLKVKFEDTVYNIISIFFGLLSIIFLIIDNASFSISNIFSTLLSFMVLFMVVGILYNFLVCILFIYKKYIIKSININFEKYMWGPKDMVQWHATQKYGIKNFNFNHKKILKETN